MTYEEFLEYQPIRELVEPKAKVQSEADAALPPVRMFGLYGSDYKAVEEAFRVDPRCIWTQLDCDGTTLIASGWHFVNRSGYYVTVRPFEGKYCEVILSEADEEEDEYA